MYSCVPASFLPALQPASLTSRPNGYAPNLLDRLAALSSIERLPRRARSYGLVWARGIVAASAGDRFIRMPEHQPLTHARAAPVQSVLASSSPASGDPSSPPPGPRPTPRPAQHSVPRSMPHLPHPLGLKAGSDEAPKRSRAQACPCRPLRHRHSSQTSLTLSAPCCVMLPQPSSAPPSSVPTDRAIPCRTSWRPFARRRRLVRHTRPLSQQCLCT